MAEDAPLLPGHTLADHGGGKDDDDGEHDQGGGNGELVQEMFDLNKEFAVVAAKVVANAVPDLIEFGSYLCISFVILFFSLLSCWGGVTYFTKSFMQLILLQTKNVNIFQYFKTKSKIYNLYIYGIFLAAFFIRQQFLLVCVQ